MTAQSATSLYINVTQEDIDEATRNNSSHCAVATAIQRQVDGLRVAVDIQTIRMTMRHTNQRRIYLTPAKAQNYIIAFDAGEKLEPFGFWLKRPAYVTHTRSKRLEQGNNAEIVPVAAAGETEVNIYMQDGTEQPAYVGLPRVRHRVAPRQTRQATRRSFGLRTMRINQEYSRSDTKQYGRNRKVKKPAEAAEAAEAAKEFEDE